MEFRSARFAVVAAAALLPVLGSGQPAQASHATTTTTPRYTVIDLGALRGGDASVAFAVNNAGVVVGDSTVSPFVEHGFRWAGGVLTDLGTTPGGGFSRARAINDAGQIAGSSGRPTSTFSYPVRWSAAGVIQDLGGPFDNALGFATGIDPAGRVVGGQRPASSSGNPLATLYEIDGTRVDLGTDLGPANGINARGQVVGPPAYVWRDGTTTFLPGVPGGFGGDARAINVAGTVVGSVTTSAATVAARWQGGVLSVLGTVDSLPVSQANAVNAAGQIVGTAATEDCVPCPAASRAWLWEAGSITPLDDLIPAGSGWTLQQANGINDRGQIVGAGQHNGRAHAYLLTPTFSVTVNFQPAGARIPAGYRADTGAAFGPRGGGLTFGWNVDNSANARDRNAAGSPDQRYDTLNHLQKPGGATRWEIAVPDGRYLVHVVAGDPSNTDSTFRITVEGRLAVSGTPNAGRRWLEGTVSVTVTDGRLTVGNGTGAANNKVNYIDVIGR